MMRKSTFISAALHTAILLFALVAFPAAKMDKAPLLAIPVDLATPSEVTKIKAGMADANDEAPLAGKPKEEKPEAVKEAKTPPEQSAAVVEKPEAEQKPEEKLTAETPKEAAPKPEKPEEKKAEEKPAKPKEAAAAPPKKRTPPATAKKRDFNTDRIAALLNKIPDAANEPSPVLPAEETPSKKVRGQSNGTHMTMSVNEIDALRSRIAQCWSPPPGGLGAGQIVVKLRLKLNEDGTLVGYPTVANSGSSPFFQAAADSAVRAVYQCQPYSLPSDKYALWRDMILNFDPSEMYRAG
ncbi:MAG: cell envelope integrity protein TolA [Methyloceanibacter sp.]